MIEVRPDKHFKQTRKFLGELPERIDSTIRDMMQNAAVELLDALRTSIPDVEDYKEYQDSLGAYEVIDPLSEWVTTGVFSHSKGSHLRVIDTSRTVLYIQPRSIGGEYSDAAVVLQEYEPWTVNTLPYEPTPREAEVIARQVSSREVKAVETHLASQIPAVHARLRNVGVTSFRGAGELIMRKVTVDLAFFALRTELGLQGYPHIPHWRPALKKIVSDPRKLMGKRVIDTMTKPNFYGWKHPDAMEPIPISEAEETEGFQDRIAV